MSTVKVSRNEPCPCGSGKKYKKCCGSKEAVSIKEVLNHEVIELQKEVRAFALTHYAGDMKEDFTDLLEILEDIDREEKEFYEFVHSFWYILFGTVDDEDSIMDEFIHEKTPYIARPRLKSILQSWAEGKAVAGIMTEVTDEKAAIKDSLTGKVYNVSLFGEMNGFEEGNFAFAILLPYGEEHLAFPAILDLPKENASRFEDYIQYSFEDAGYDHPEVYLAEYFIDLMNETPKSLSAPSMDNFDWPSKGAENVADIFRKDMEQAGEEPWIIGMGISLWMEYCEKTGKQVKKPDNYVAGLRYLVTTIAPVMETLTQKEIGEKYGISGSRVSNYYGDIYNEVEDTIRQLIESSNVEEVPPVQSHNLAMESEMHDIVKEIQELGLTDMEEINDYMEKRVNEPGPKRNTSQSKEDKAQDLIYAAMEESGKKRVQLAEQALELNPNHPDAYNILGEEASSITAALTLFEKGVKLGREELGQDFFKQNKGYFWGLIETRPYMRAAANFAAALEGAGRIKDAISQYEELLELNPDDNQGIRDLLFSAYCADGQLKKAQKLLKQYEETTAENAYNQVLLELLANGFTAKADKLLKEAKRSNKYVVDYLTGKKKLPAELPDYYGFGDQNEAMIIAGLKKHLWDKISGVKEWLKK
ncbi:SEC-C domain-containing protein [Bacillus sp. ISL-47]|uniref:SEC-C metal-binding domain-containing protein n=1 Tax=Bacillus sp. ISL-47 TaxID=2819130 RepID=UPI001BEA9869|nr:SEC-C metal-binding domain-containing protein [Bacillus sp. ISL-47]MBT2687139.1 SEC-C domain-containing protein [Bacillus sp. ISL-47]MBT2709737.1 SEC-C domain-containing protein [Pseudomonas sp. ISL-84]